MKSGQVAPEPKNGTGLKERKEKVNVKSGLVPPEAKNDTGLKEFKEELNVESGRGFDRAIGKLIDFGNVHCIIR